MFKITLDHLFTADTDQSPVGLEVDEMPLYGVERALGLGSGKLPADAPMVKFRLKDDDGQACYDGELHDDPDCENQTAALRWGESYAGATMILVLRGNDWVQEIG